MTEAPAQERTSENGSGDGEGGSLLGALPTDQLFDAGRRLLGAVAGRAVDAALEKVDGLTDRLTDVAGNGGAGLASALTGGGGDDDDDDEGGGGGGIGAAIKSGAAKVKDTVTGALGFGGGGSDDEDGDEDGDGEGGGGGGGASGARGKFKFLNIFEAQDVGVPLRVCYDQWTQFADFPSFMKKLETVDQTSDEKSTWKAQVFLSHRTWETTIVEQIPDTHIVWTSTGAKGHADGCVTFSEVAPNLTRIVLILEYYPQGFFEKTANIWRAVGRRARLEFKHFCRHVMMDTLVNRDELEGWRGTIRDSEVVKTHEEALQEEQEAAEGGSGETQLFDSDGEPVDRDELDQYEQVFDADGAVVELDEDGEPVYEDGEPVDDADELDEDESDDEFVDSDESDDDEDEDESEDDEPVDESEDEPVDEDDEPVDEDESDDAADRDGEDDGRRSRRSGRSRRRQSAPA